MIVALLVAGRASAQGMPYEDLMQDVLIAADLWSPQPEILSAAFGFEGIIGVPFNENAVRAAGGTWIQFPPGTPQPQNRTITSAAPSIATIQAFGTATNRNDAMPIVFSWPVLPSTAQPTDFLIQLSNGTSVNPLGVSILPCHEFNERNVVVLVGEFGNRLRQSEPGAIYPVRLDIVDDGSPLMLVGPGGVPQSAVGLSRQSPNPYELNNGPSLVGAKLSRMAVAGEGAPAPFQVPVNDGVALYGSDAQYRLRVLTTGGFSPNGVSGLTPDAFERFFRLHVTDAGMTVLLTQTGIDYTFPEGTIRIVGLAELGNAAGLYDLTYVEDWDNYIDIILKGDLAAMRKIQAVEIPATGTYERFYNPGGPGNNPTPGVRYTEPGPADIEPVLIALDDPMTVTYVRPIFSTTQAGPGAPVTVRNDNLLPGHEYYNLFSLDLCPGGPGTGLDAFGLCILSLVNLNCLADQLLLPVGTDPFHFIASASTQIFGPYVVAPVTLEGLCLDFTGGLIGPASEVVRIEVR